MALASSLYRWMQGRPYRWIGRPGGEPVLFEFKVLKIGRLLAVKLHWFVDGDAPGCFHTHPAWALRLVLDGHYREEMEDGRRRDWRPYRCGLVRPRDCHRVYLPTTSRGALTLWITGPKVAPIYLRGPGWEALGLSEGLAATEKSADT